MSDQQIIRNYRLDREGIYTLCDKLREDLEKSIKRSRSLPVSLQIVIALRYYSSGSYMNVIGDAHGVSKMSVSLLTCKHTISTVIMNLKVTRVGTKIGLACSMLYYIYLCKYVLIFISDNGIKGWLSTHRTGLSLHFLNVPVLSEEPFARVFVCLFLTFVFFLSEWSLPFDIF